MIALLLSSLLSLFLFTTFGIFVTSKIKIPTNYVEKILIGLVVSNTITTCLSLFFPINIFILVLLILVSSFLLFLIRKEIKILVSLIYQNRYVLFCSLPFILIAFIISLDFPDNAYDTGLYHLQSIKWIEEYSVVPGLANLHGRFGFNPNIFTFFALTSIYDIFKQEIFSINFTVLIVLVFYFVNKLYSLYKNQGFSNLFVFYVFVFIVILKSPVLATPSPDFLSRIIPLFIFVRIIELSGQKVKLEFKSYIPILILSVYMLTVKIAVLPILLLFIFVFIRYKFELRKIVWLLLVLSLIILPWLARNIILTGWLVYPFSSLDLFNFDWQVPLASVIGEKKLVTGWARDPGINYLAAANMAFIDWFPIWWQKLSLTLRVFFIISLAFPLIALTGRLIKRIKIDFFTDAVIITSFFGVLFWLYMAPVWRFGEPFIIIASISPLLLLKFYWIPAYKTNLVFSTIMFVLIGYFAFGNYNIIKDNTFEALNSNRMIVPQKIEVPVNVTFETYNINGVDIYVPIDDERCFDHKIPCTPYPDTTLILRGNTLKSGFKHVLKNK